MTYRQPETCPRCPGAVRCGMSRAAPLAGVGRGGRGAEPPPAWSRPVTTALWGSSVCQGRS